MQKGFATIEIIFAVMIMTLLGGFAIPNAARLIDKVSLDYETKRLYSELRFIQAMNRSSAISSTGTGGVISVSNTRPYLLIESAKKRYQVFKGTGNNKKAIREPHYLPDNVTIKFRENATTININFDSEGKVEINSNESSSNKETTIHLISRFGKGSEIVFDSVGRIHAALAEE